MKTNLAESLPDYRDIPEAYEIEERSRPDEMAMIRGMCRLAYASLNDIPRANVLELCCGTGLSMEAVIDHPNIAQIVGVDISESYLGFAEKTYQEKPIRPSFIRADAVDIELEEGIWDVILLASAYHHIEDERKVTFLKKVKRLLRPGRSAFFAENILPPYQVGDRSSYCAAVRLFYDEVLRTAREENQNLPTEVEQLIERVAVYGFDGDYEYKVHYDIFKAHLAEAGLRVLKEERVWPQAGPMKGLNAGNYILQVC